MTDLSPIQAAQAIIVIGSQPDGSETTPVRSTVGGDLGTADVLVSGGAQTVLTVGVSAVAARVGAANLANRKALTVMPTDGSVFWGYSNAVTAATGTEIFKNQQVTFAVSGAVTIWLIAAATRNVRITEGA